MGASGWSYFVAYTPDPNDALSALREEVFKSGEFFRLDPDAAPSTIQELLELNETEGTHTILDMMHGCSSDPSSSYFGTLQPLPNEMLTALLGTAQPTRDQVKDKAHVLAKQRTRWVGTYVVVYKDGEPDEYFFTGYSGD